MKTILKNVGKVALAIGICVFTSTIARAVWDSTSGNMPNFYRLCWGLDSVACIYGSSISDNVSIQTGGTDALTIDSAQAIVMSGALTVNGALTMPDATVTTAKVATNAVTTSKFYLDLATARAACVTSSRRIGVCSTAVDANGQCTCA